MARAQLRDRLSRVVSELDSILQDINPGSDVDSGPLAVEVMRGMVPAARLRASRARTGRWYAYLVMPKSWRPPSDSGPGRWMFNESQGHYWTDASGDTEDEALRGALKRLIDA